MALTTDIDRFRDAIRARFGLAFDVDKYVQLSEVLGRRTAATRGSVAAYLADLERSGPVEELRALAEELTVNETYFFRNIEQFRAFEDVALRPAAREGRRLRVLSAGCASGEEPYSVAMLALQASPAAGVTVHAFDIHTVLLERAARGHYSAWSLRETPPDERARWFRIEGSDAVLDARVRSMVTFEERNLTAEDEDFYRPSAFDVIFCRNVLMYLTPDAALAVLGRLVRSLVPGGLLFLGHAESARGRADELLLRHSHATFYYQRRMDGEVASPSEADAARVPPADESWVETIALSAARIEGLAQSTHALEPLSAPPVWDLRPVLALLGKERFSEAHATLAGLPAQSATDPDVLLIGAVLATHRGDLADAERMCRELLRIDATHAGAHYVSALCREGSGDDAAAAEHDRMATRLDPTFGMPQLHLGLLARRAGDFARARAELSLALTLIEREDAARVLLFGGGFTRDALVRLCASALTACGGTR